MRTVLQVLTVVLTALGIAPALAHALELPGKMRLAKDVYFAVQRIYYPGFTIAGIAEPGAFISSIVLLLFTPRVFAFGRARFQPEPAPPSGRTCVTGGNMRTWLGRDWPP